MNPPRHHRFSWKVLLVAGLIGLVAAVLLARPATYRYHLWRARQAIAERQPQRALDALATARQVGGESGELYYVMARAQRHREAYPEVVSCLKQAHRLGYSTDKLDREQLLAMAESAELPPRDPRLTALLDNPGGDTREIYEALVKGCYRLHEIGLARLVLDSWQRDFPQDPQPRLYRGRLAEYNESWKDAERWYAEAVALAPDRLDLILDLARTRLKQRRYRQALADYDAILQVDASVAGFAGRGECLWMLGRLAEAREAFQQGLQLEPDNYECLLALGEMDVEAGRGADALRWLERAAEQQPRDYDVRYALGKALLYAGQGDQAKPHFEFAARAREALSRVDVLRNYVASHPEDADRRYEIGAAMLAYGDVNEALDWLHSALHYDPQHQLAHAALADYYEQLGDDDAAREHRQFTSGHSS